MKILKYLLFLFLIFIIGASVYVATKDGDFQIEETLVIDAPKEVLFNEVNDYVNWKSWEPWSKNAEDMIINFGNKTSGKGAYYTWKSEDLGDGKIETLSSRPYTSIDQALTFKTLFGESRSAIYWNFEEVNGATEVTWGMQGKQSFMEKLAFIFQKKSLSEMMRPKFKEGLEDMREVALNKMQKYNINVDGVIQHGGGYYMYITTASKISQVDTQMERMLEEVSNFMNTNNIEIIGSPFVLYNQWNREKGTAIYSAGYFTPSEVITPMESTVLNDFLPNQKTLKTTLKGDYKNLQEAWTKAYGYIARNNLIMKEDANSFEVYVRGIKDSKNPADWITHLYIPLQTKEETEN